MCLLMGVRLVVLAFLWFPSLGVDAKSRFSGPSAVVIEDEDGGEIESSFSSSMSLCDSASEVGSDLWRRAPLLS